jgi:hypothetical protein
MANGRPRGAVMRAMNCAEEACQARGGARAECAMLARGGTAAARRGTNGGAGPAQGWRRRPRRSPATRRRRSPASGSRRKADISAGARAGHRRSSARPSACSRRSRPDRVGRDRRSMPQPIASARPDRAQARRRARTRPACGGSGDACRQCRVGALPRPSPLPRRRGRAFRPRRDIGGRAGCDEPAISPHRRTPPARSRARDSCPRSGT